MKSMKLLIDANILLDVLQNREPFVGASSVIWKLCETEKTVGYAAVLSFAILVYVMREQLDSGNVSEVLLQLSLIFSLVEFVHVDLPHAAQLECLACIVAVMGVTA